MNTFGKVLGIFLVLFLFLALQAQAVTITFNYQTPGDGSGKTSPYFSSDNIGDVNHSYYNSSTDTMYYIETFDVRDDDGDVTGGGFTTLDVTDIDITPSDGTIGFANTSVTSAHAAPLDDDTYYAYIPGTNTYFTNHSSLSVMIDLVDFTTYVPNTYISYLGLYYGSIDNYNNLKFYNSDGELITGSGALADGILEGSEIRTAGTAPGDWYAEGSNIYVNLEFDANERFSAFAFETTGVAFEVDNIVSGVRAVPEPATMLLLGVGLVGLAGVSRRKLKK